MSQPAWRWLALLALLGGALLAVTTGAQNWWIISEQGGAFSGNQATNGLAQALALVVLAASGLSLLWRTVGKRILAIILTGGGIAMIALGILNPPPTAKHLGGFTPLGLAADSARSTLWPTAYALAGLVVVVGALALLVTAGVWPQGAGRFDRRRTADICHDPRELWKSLDAGIDPTDPIRRADSLECGDVGQNGHSTNR